MNTKYQPEIVTHEAMTLFGLHVYATYPEASFKCPALWEKFRSGLEDLNQFTTHGSFGLSVMQADVTGGFTYWAALQFVPGASIPTGMEYFELPGGYYVKLLVDTLPELSAAYAFLYNDAWLSENSPYKINLDAPCFEFYPKDYHQFGKFYIHVPVNKVT